MALAIGTECRAVAVAVLRRAGDVAEARRALGAHQRQAFRRRQGPGAFRRRHPLVGAAVHPGQPRRRLARDAPGGGVVGAIAVRVGEGGERRVVFRRRVDPEVFSGPEEARDVERRLLRRLVQHVQKAVLDAHLCAELPRRGAVGTVDSLGAYKLVRGAGMGLVGEQELQALGRGHRQRLRRRHRHRRRVRRRVDRERLDLAVANAFARVVEVVEGALHSELVEFALDRAGGVRRHELGQLLPAARVEEVEDGGSVHEFGDLARVPRIAERHANVRVLGCLGVRVLGCLGARRLRR